MQFESRAVFSMVNTTYYHLNYLRDIFRLPCLTVKITYDTGQTTALPRRLPLYKRITYFTQLITADNAILSAQLLDKMHKCSSSLSNCRACHSSGIHHFSLFYKKGIHKPHLWLQKVSKLMLNFQLQPFCCLSVGKNLGL